MKPFRFTLEALHTLRQRQEQLALESYGKALEVRRAASARLQTVQAQLTGEWRWWQERFTQGVTAVEIAQGRDYCNLLEQRRRECKAEVDAAQQQVDRTWEALVVARQQREAVEKYHQRQRQRYDRELHREEQKILDEMAGRRTVGTVVWKPGEKSVWN